jgi:chromosomal replication initiator protein
LSTKPSAGKDDEPVPGVFDAEMIKNPFIIPGIRRVKIESQLNVNYTFDNFIEGDCNRLARNAGLAIAKKPGGTAFNPLVIFGDVGLGKTHLAQAIGNEIAAKIESKAVLYVSAEKFTNQIIQAIKNNSVNDFVNFYQMVDVLIIDDIQFLSGKQKTQEIFFHIFNQLHQNGKQVILTSDRAPKDLEGIEDRLISRFKWGLSADLQAPDLETRMAILDSKINEEGVEIPQDVLEFICYNIKNNIRELEGVMISLLAQSTLIRRDIDMDLAKEVIRNFVTTINKEITVEFIQQLVAEHFNVPVDKLHHETRKRNVVIARQLSMFLAKKMTNKSLKTIGENFGGRDHSTVIYSCKAVQDMMDTDMIFKDTVAELEKKIKMSLNE